MAGGVVGVAVGRLGGGLVSARYGQGPLWPLYNAEVASPLYSGHSGPWL